MKDLDEKIVLIGSSGFVGQRLKEILPENKTLIPTSSDLNILNKTSIQTYLKQVTPKAVINLAAFTNVKEAELQRNNKKGLTWQINVIGADNLAKVTNDLGVFLEHISTDCVNPGSIDFPGPLDESAKLINNPKLMSWYAYTKLVSEQSVRANLKSSIIRISFPFGSLNPNKDYALKLIKAIQLGYSIFDDQSFTPTYIDDLAEAIIKITLVESRGIFHVACNSTNPYEFGSYLARKISLNQKIKKGSLQELKNPTVINQYPPLGGLNTDETQNRLGIKFHTWQEALDKFIPRILSKFPTLEF